MTKEFKGFIAVIDGSDSSGKESVTNLVYEKLKANGYNTRKISYPNYNSDSSALVKMYLSGYFGEDASTIDPYQASSFFAVDRVAHYLKDWKEFYENGGIILIDRYVSSNIIHQAAKIEDKPDKILFINWCLDFEYNKLMLPRPDLTFFLDMPTEFSAKLSKNRLNKINGKEEKDIHENNFDFLRKSYENANYVCNLLSWEKIHCTKEYYLKSLEEISNEVYEKINNTLIGRV